MQAKQITTILRLPAVINMTGLSRSTIYNLVNSKDFPERIRLGPRSVGWLDHEVESWLAARTRLGVS